MNVEGMKVTKEQMTQLMMVRDMQEFGNSIVEIMIGRTTEEATAMQMQKREP